MPAPLVVSTPHPRLLEAVLAAGDPLPEDAVEFVDWRMEGPAPRDRFDIVVPPFQRMLPSLRFLDGVTARLVQSQLIGYDGVADALPPGHVYANAATVHETSTAELTLALILASQRGIPHFLEAQSRGAWEPLSQQSLADRTVLLLGYGGVNQAVEARLAGFETTVVRVATRAREAEQGHVHGIDELPELLPDADVVVVAVPLGDATRGLVSAEFLARLKDDALVVNVARGLVADTDAVLAEADRLRFALDVTEPEPLPAGHPLYAKPNVLITPHVGGATSAMTPRMGRLVRRQIDHALAGEPFENVVLTS